MEDMGSESTAAAKKKLVECCTKLQKKAKDKGVVGQQWWPEANAAKPAKKKADVNSVEETAMDARLAKLEGTMVAALSALNMATASTAQGTGTGLPQGAGQHPFVMAGSNASTNPFASPSTNPFSPAPVDILAIGGAAQPGGAAQMGAAAMQPMQQLQAQILQMQQQLQQASQQPLGQPQQQQWGQRQRQGQR